MYMYFSLYLFLFTVSGLQIAVANALLLVSINPKNDVFSCLLGSDDDSLNDGYNIQSNMKHVTDDNSVRI